MQRVTELGAGHAAEQRVGRGALHGTESRCRAEHAYCWAWEWALGLSMVL